MRKGILTGIMATTALLAPAGAQAYCEGEGANPSELSLQQARDTTICLINEVRRNAGVRPVSADKRLERAAQRHSGAMDSANFFSHYGPGGSNPLTRIRRTGYLSGASNWGIGENLRWGTGGYGSPKVAISSWLNSPPHRATMLSGRYRNVGIGVAFGTPTGGGGGDAAIYTANFGYRK